MPRFHANLQLEFIIPTQLNDSALQIVRMCKINTSMTLINSLIAASLQSYIIIHIFKKNVLSYAADLNFFEESYFFRHNFVSMKNLLQISRKN